jgi:protein involved in polysaccharide export with SLBB domain
VIYDRVSAQLMGVRVSVTMGELRSIRVFVLGDAELPGSYTVSGLSTITNALYVSGGVKPIGSLRNIQLKRGGKTVAKLDLYDLLLQGDTSDDVRLQPGDAIFIPPVGKTVGIGGEVRRPAIYEVGEAATIADVLALSGGLNAEADPKRARLDRIDDVHARTTVDIDLSSSQARGRRMQSGDVLMIPRVRPTLSRSVRLEGHVFRPGAYGFEPGMRLSDLIRSVEEVKPDADLGYVLIRRERPGDRSISVISANLSAALRAPHTASDPQLAERDRVYVFDTTTSRDRIVDPIIAELRRQGSPELPSAVVSIGGSAKVPGTYPLEPGMKVSDLVRAGGGLDVSAYRNEAELTRYEVVGGEKREARVLNVDLQRAVGGDPEADIELRPFDVLVVKEISEWSELEYVTLEGEFRFPGSYPIKRGETMQSVIQRAGGLTELAFVEGSVFTRADLKEREQRQLRVLAERLQRDLASLALQATQSSPQGAAQAGEAVAIGQNLLADLRDTEAVGRLVINLNSILQSEPGSETDIVLRNGDRLAVPKRAQEVTVIGEVQSATSHLYNPAWSRDDYIDQSGGTTQKADDSRIFVIRADGSVDAGSGSNHWFARSSESDIRPGDTIVIPLDAERMRPLPLWTAVTTIIYNLAVAVAAVNSF